MRMNLDAAQRIVRSSSILKDVEIVEYLDEGFSSDDKYVLWEGDVPKYVLRLSGIQHQERRRREFENMGHHYERGVSCPKPHVFGVTDDGKLCYSLLGYIQGRNGLKALPEMSEAQQFEAGVQAGRELLKIHGLKCPDQGFDWAAYRRAKYRRRLEQLEELGLTFFGQEEVEKYVKENDGLLDDAPVHFQHDDFHPANLIFNGGTLAGVIDFNRSEWGDPIEDFYKVPWFTVDTSVPFALGQFQGYFADGVPTDFWRRYNLYVAMNLHGSLVWIMDEDAAQLDYWLEKDREIVETHDPRHGGPPVWYRG